MIVLLTQLLLPLLLLAWLSRFPARNRLAVGMQAAGTGLLLVALALVSPWMFLPWWLPWLYLLVWLAIVLTRIRTVIQANSPWPRGRQWLMVAVAGLLTVLGGAASVSALVGRVPPAVQAVNIRSPLGEGLYLVAHGGASTWVNGHMKTLDASVPRFADWRGQSYAVDLIGIDTLGRRSTGWQPGDPAAYLIFGQPVLAPCSGNVISAEATLADMPVPVRDRDNMLGNHVMVQCAEAAILLAHLRQGSVRVSPGDVVEAGTVLGQVGNSGNTTEPHLHVHAQRRAADGQPLISGAPLALLVDGEFLVRNDRLSINASP
ncbi:MAG: M23 family metallopeptidase [Alcanivoracaceae bacterium]|nr:M23 family metallopeptidase [Alcanivoracaceae bacterium]